MKFVLVLLACAACASGAMSKHIASYDIKATLDTKSHIITGNEVLTWFNDSPDTVATLRFHLYMNAFRNSRSTFFRESGGQLRGDQFKGDDWGWVEIKKMDYAGADLTGAIRFIHPDDDNTEDRTVIEVPLNKPVKPGETVQVAIAFETKLPAVFARTGFHGDFYLGGQWFPKLGVWEKAGFRYSTAGAWNCHQFHANSEFFANFGAYHVELTLPSNMVVGATGELKNKTESRGRTTYTYEQEDVTDFAWTAQPSYLREERMFLADKETTPQEIAAVAKLHGIPESEAKLTDVKMIALVQPEHREQMERHFHALRSALKWFGLWYGHYPYKTITVVDPPANADGAGGMEYPTFITGGTLWRLPPESHMLEEVVVHEFGHQFWMQLVATNEFEESPLDEGFNTFSTSQVMDKVYGGMGGLPVTFLNIDLWKLMNFPGISDSSLSRAQYLFMPAQDDMLRKAWQYYNSTSYALNSYAKMGVTLETLRGVLGRDTFDRVMRTYQQRWRFNHPTARDFQKIATEVSGRNLDWFFDQFFFGNRLLDYSIGDISNNRRRTSMGAFEKDGRMTVVTRKEAEVQDNKDDDNKNLKKQYECTVKIKRVGDAVVPVDIWIHFKDGGTEKRTWDGEYRWVKYTFLRGSEIDWVQVDPDRKYRLDISYANNSWQSKANPGLAGSWGMQLLFWVQNLTLWMTSLV